MKTFVQLFISSAIFGVVIGVAYWFVAHEEATGTMLLGIMTAALTFTAGYAVIAERNANLDGDRQDMLAPAAAGEDLGIFTIESAWPILVALSCVFMLTGLLWSPFVAAAGLVALLLCLWRLGAESART